MVDVGPALVELPTVVLVRADDDIVIAVSVDVARRAGPAAIVCAGLVALACPARARAEAGRAAIVEKRAPFGGLPVVRGDLLVGIITESDLFRIFVELFGARQKGVRVTMYIPQVKGELASISSTIAEAGGNILAFGSVAGEDPTNVLCMVKVDGIPKDELTKLLEPCNCRVKDVRET